MKPIDPDRMLLITMWFAFNFPQERAIELLFPASEPSYRAKFVDAWQNKGLLAMTSMLDESHRVRLAQLIIDRYENKTLQEYA